MWESNVYSSSLDRQDLLRTADTYIASFTTEGDMLGQWRGYGLPGDAYALGFDRVAIEKLAAEAPRRLVPPGRSDPFPDEDGVGHFTARLFPCIYDDTEKQAAVLDTLKSAVRSNEEGTFASSSVPDWAFEGTLWSDLARIACQLKHSSFNEECEKRLVVQGVRPQDLWFRKGSTYLVPYVKLALSAAGEEFPLREVIVGPGPNQKLALAAAEQFLASLDLTRVRVRPSNSPYRPW